MNEQHFELLKNYLQGLPKPEVDLFCLPEEDDDMPYALQDGVYVPLTDAAAPEPLDPMSSWRQGACVLEGRNLRQLPHVTICDFAGACESMLNQQTDDPINTLAEFLDLPYDMHDEDAAIMRLAYTDLWVPEWMERYEEAETVGQKLDVMLAYFVSREWI